jgi:hypothetical protein
VHDIFPPKERQDPQLQAAVEPAAARVAQGFDDVVIDVFTQMLGDIEKIAAASSTDGSFRPGRLVAACLHTGQLTAVSMRVPGSSGAYLVLFHDQMLVFVKMLADAVVWAMPQVDPTDANGKLAWKLKGPSVAERIMGDPEVADRFARIIVPFAVEGTLRPTLHRMSWAQNVLAKTLRDSLVYFILGHECAHVLLGHLDTTPERKGVLPAAEAEALAYSWTQEFDADAVGMYLSTHALARHLHHDIISGFWGSTLYFDALDVMDRAVALLQTGEENARQLGSHPPSELRKEHLRDFLPQMAMSSPAAAEHARRALELAQLQEEIIRLLWERTRPTLLDLHRRGVPAVPTWRTIPKETSDGPAPTD